MKLELGLYQAAPMGSTEAYQKPRKKQMTEKQKRKKLLQYKFPLRKRLALEFGSNKYTLTKESYWHPLKVAEMTDNGFTRMITMQPNGKILETLLTQKYSMLSSNGWGRIECQRIEQYDGTGKLIRKFYSIPQKRMVNFPTRDYPFEEVYNQNGRLETVLKEGKEDYLKKDIMEKMDYLKKCTIDKLCDGYKYHSVDPNKDGSRVISGWKQTEHKYSVD